MPHKTTLLSAILMIHCLFGMADDTGETKEFAEFQCKLTLPGPGFDWLDHSMVPQAQVALGNDSGMLLLMLTEKAPDGFILNESFVEGFDNSFFESDDVSKLGGAIITFRGVPCYQLHARLHHDDSIATVRAFGANGHLYLLQLIGSELPIEGRGELESVFSSFEFLGTPVLPTPAPPPPPGNQAYDFSEKMGRIARFCILAIIVLSVAGMLLRKKKKVS